MTLTTAASCRMPRQTWPMMPMSANTNGVMRVRRVVTDVTATTLRYRYRVYPDTAQRQMLARTFGCVRVVYNDSIAVRQDAYRDEVRLSDAEVQRQVVTLAKHTPDRQWLAEVSSVALVQACRDSRTAYRNWFNSLSGERRGRKVGAPRFRRKHSRQSFRLTRSGFALRPDGTVYLAKIGNVKVRWSRDLPSEPSSVTIIQEADGRYYASFVVQRTTPPLPEVDSMVGVDLGLTHFATLSTGEKIDNPRYLRAAERRLATAQRSLSRKQKGSANRAKARRRVAVLHRKVRDKRLDHAHKLADRLVNEKQVVAVETLSINGMVRTRLAKSVSDAGWAQFVRLLEEKAAERGRTVVKIDRWEPSTRRCNECQTVGDKLSLSVREWTCRTCGAWHDRDQNAALNIRAAGLAVQACGGDVRQEFALAVACEAGTHEVAP